MIECCVEYPEITLTNCPSKVRIKAIEPHTNTFVILDELGSPRIAKWNVFSDKDGIITLPQQVIDFYNKHHSYKLTVGDYIFKLKIDDYITKKSGKVEEICIQEHYE